jgi:hypothetical protein
LYAYARGNRSSRGIERACEEDVVYKLITAMRVPDHSTIAEFRRRHERALAELFTSVLALCREAGLVEVGVISIDGTKIRANASRGANRTYEKLVADILKEAEETDRWEDGLFGRDRGDELPEHLRTEEGRRAAFKAAKERLAKQAPEPEVAQIEVDPTEPSAASGWGRRAWHREGRKALLRQREQDARPMARSRAERLLEALRRLEENHQVELQANEAYAAWKAERIAAGGHRVGGPSKPFMPPQVPEGVMNKTDHDSRMMRTEGQPTVQGYNAQAAVTRGQIIVAAEIAVESPDFGHLEPTRARCITRARCCRSGTAARDGAGRCGLLAQAADREHRQRRRPGVGPARWRPSERHQARMGQEYVCVHAQCALQRGRSRALQAPKSDSRASVRADQVQPQDQPIPASRDALPRYRNGGWSRPRTTC